MSQPSVVQPGGLIDVTKPFGRSVKVGLLDANRVVAQGFSINHPVHQHFRVLRHGTFSVMVLTDQPVDVCLIKDGALVAEERFDPLPQASGPDSSDVRRQARELSRAPRSFYLSTDRHDNPLCFAPDHEHRSVQERLALQLYSGPSQLVPQPVVTRPDEPVNEPTPGLQTIAEAPSNRLCWNPDSTSFDDQPAELSNTADDDMPMAGELTNAAASLAVNEVADEPLEAELFDAQGVAHRWAPSSGLLAVGVRMVQVETQGEPLLPPDGFDWVLIQVNTFEEHALVRANLLGRINPLPDDDDSVDRRGRGGLGDSYHRGSQRFRV